MEIAFSHQYDAGRKRRDDGADDFRARFLKRLCQYADAKLERGGSRETDLETIAGKIDIVGRIALPDGENDVDRLGENLVAILIQYSDRLGIGRERARTYAHDKAPLRKVVEHRGVDRNDHRMHLRQVGGPGGKLDGLGVVNERRLEHHAVGDVLARIGQMLAHEGIVEAELVSEDDRLTILAQRLGPVPVHRMNGHGEVTQPHQAFSTSTAIGSCKLSDPATRCSKSSVAPATDQP
jgi:hypothetical protein